MNRITAVTISVLMLAPLSAQAQPQAKAPTPAPAPAAAPQPGPEHKKLAIWIGDWTVEGDFKATPIGPAGKLSEKMTARSVLGGFFVEFRGEDKSPWGATQWIELDGYDPVAKRFTWYCVGNDGSVTDATYTIDSNNVSYSGTLTVGDKQCKMRGTMVFAADFMSIVDKREISCDGKTWMPFAEGKSIKSKSSPK